MSDFIFSLEKEYTQNSTDPDKFKIRDPTPVFVLEIWLEGVDNMKSLEDIKEILKEQEKVLSEKFKVKSIKIFGSYARNEQREGSDVDMIVDFSEPIGLEFIGLKDYLEGILGIKVDLVTPRSIRKQMKKSILREAVKIK